MKVPVWLKPGVWGAIIGSVATMMIGFSMMGWTLNSTAQKAAQDRTELALTAALTPFCVESFMKQPDAAKRLTGLREVESWKQQEFVEKGGWATMNGNKEPTPGLATACAHALLKAKT